MTDHHPDCKKQVMKVSNKSILIGVIAVGILTISSCAPMYKCGDPMPEKQKGGKRLQAVVSERDSLCMALADQKMANDRLTTDNRALQNRLSGQENINENQSEQLSQKNRDLQNKERMLRLIFIDIFLSKKPVLKGSVVG